MWTNKSSSSGGSLTYIEIQSLHNNIAHGPRPGKANLAFLRILTAAVQPRYKKNDVATLQELQPTMAQQLNF